MRQCGEDQAVESLVRNLARTSRHVGWSSADVRVRSAKDSGLKVAEKRRGHGMESGLRLRHARAGRRCGVVLGLIVRSKGCC